MRSIIIILTTIILHKLSNALTTTICNSMTTCLCMNNQVWCTKLIQDPPFILPNNSTTLHFVNVTTKIFNNNTLTHAKLQNITWVASNMTFVEALYYNDLKYLDLSKNNLYKLADDTFINCPQLEHVDLSNNRLTFLSENLFFQKTLHTVRLENNIFHSISKNVFKKTINLKNLTIGNPNLYTLAKTALANLVKLEYLSIENSRIENLNKSSFGEHKYLTSIILNNCTDLKSIESNFINSAPNIEVIELNNCNTINYLPQSIISLKKLRSLQMFKTEVQPNCHNGWFSQWFNETTVVKGYETHTNLIEAMNKIDCPAKIYYTSESITLHLTKEGIINCMAFGNPLPAITWLVPGGLTFHENKEADTNISNHPNMHNWDLKKIDSQSLSIEKNGSLHILRMLRTNIGNYTCFVSNKYGNDSKMVEVHLDSGVFFNIKINALILGITSALAFLMLTILCCAFKMVLIRLNCIKKNHQSAEAEMEATGKTKAVPEDV